MKTVHDVFIFIRLVSRLFFCVLLTLPLAIFGQGSLTAPGAPAPVMKTLEQIEPRSDVIALPGDGSNLHIITNAGSYYLTTNLVLAVGKKGISVRANNVCIDLNGFSVLGVPSSGSGIDLPNNQTNLVVRNGAITGTGFYGIDADLLYYGTFENLILIGNTYVGINCGHYSTVRNCLVATNGGEGILAKDHCVVMHCTAFRNGLGIHTGFGQSRFDGNHLVENGYGLKVDNSNNLILRNAASGNGTNYQIAANNKVGPIVSAPTSGAISGSTGGSGLGTNDPWANFSY